MLISRRSLFTKAVGIALACLTTSARAQDNIAKPFAETAPAPLVLPAPPSMILLHPSWTLSPPVTDSGVSKRVRTLRVLTENHPAVRTVYRVQVSAESGKKEAIVAQDALGHRLPALFEDYQVLIWQTGSGDRYAVMVGFFETADDANEVCATVKTAGGPCLVQIERSSVNWATSRPSR